jgi:hypothetical protein
MVDYLADGNSQALWLDMGLGKTAIVLHYLADRIDRCLPTKALVLAPKLVAETVWRQENVKWGTHLRVDFVSPQIEFFPESDVDVMCINNLPWLLGQYVKDSKWRRKWPYNIVVLDEAAYFKDPKGVWFGALSQISHKTGQIIELTGTPSPNGLVDIWAQTFLLDHGRRLGKTVTEYKRVFLHPTDYVYTKRGLKPVKYVANDPQDIYDRLSDITVSMRASDWLELPEQVNVRVMVPIPRNPYYTMSRAGVCFVGRQRIMTSDAGVLYNKLAQIANGAVYDDRGEVAVVHDAKLDALDGLLQATTSPVLVFTAYQHDVSRILARFPQAVELTDVDAWNRGELPVAVAHPASIGHGLNLQAGGNTIVWFGVPVNLGWYLQGNARLVRQGQKAEQVIVHHLIAVGTLEEQVMDVLERKNATQDDLLEAVRHEY